MSKTPMNLADEASWPMDWLIFRTSQSKSRAYVVFANESRASVAAFTSRGFSMAPSRVSMTRVRRAFSRRAASTRSTAAASASAARAASPARTHPSSAASSSPAAKVTLPRCRTPATTRITASCSALSMPTTSIARRVARYSSALSTPPSVWQDDALRYANSVDALSRNARFSASSAPSQSW